MAITKIQTGAFPADVVTTAAIDDLSVTHAKLHTDMDLSSKTVTLPVLNHSLSVDDNSAVDNSWNTLAQLHPNVSDGPAEAGIRIQSYPSTTSVPNRKAGIQSQSNIGVALPLVLNKDGGKVGIGTDSPVRTLHVVSDTVGDVAAFEGTNNGIVIQGHGSDANIVEIVGYKQSDATYADVHIRANSTGLIVKEDSGNVGVGTINPLQKLSVSGRMNVDQQSDYYGAWIDGNTSGDSWFAVGTWYSNGGRMTAGSIEGQGLHLYTHNTSHQLTLQKDGGNVIVGATDIPNTGDSGTIAHAIATIPGTISAKGSIWSAPSIPSNKQVQANRWRFGGYTLQYHGGIDYRSDASYAQLILELPNGGPSGKSNLELFEIGFNYGWSSGFYMVEVFETYYVNSGYKMYQFNSGYNPAFNLHQNYGNNAISLDVLSEGTFADGTTSTPQSSTDNSYYRKTVRASYGAYHGGIVKVTIPSYCRFTDNGSEVIDGYQIRLLNPQ